MKSAIRTNVKKFVNAVVGKDKGIASSEFVEMVKKLDTAARKGIIKKNTAARKKSRMQKLLNGMGA